MSYGLHPVLKKKFIDEQNLMHDHFTDRMGDKKFTFSAHQIITGLTTESLMLVRFSLQVSGHCNAQGQRTGGGKALTLSVFHTSAQYLFITDVHFTV